MGMFDTVWLPCPNCGKQVGFQSKAGECILRDYSCAAPIAIAEDVDGDTESCEGCDEYVTAKMAFTVPELVPMKGV